MPRKNNDMVRTNVYLPRKLHQGYKKLAKLNGVPMADLMREDLLRGLKLRIAEVQRSVPPQTVLEAAKR